MTKSDVKTACDDTIYTVEFFNVVSSVWVQQGEPHRRKIDANRVFEDLSSKSGLRWRIVMHSVRLVYEPPSHLKI